MISVLGYKRIVVLAVLLGIAVIMAGAVYYYLTPQKQQAERDLRAVRGQVSATQNDIEKVRTELDKLAGQKDTFEELKKIGFFSEQDRIVAKDRLEEIQELSSVLAVRYRIEPAEIETNPQIEKAEHVILSSPFKIEVEALDDIDIYRFIYLLQTSFPGHASFDGVTITRGQEVNDSSLRRILTNNPVALVKATINFRWRTILPEDRVVMPGDAR
jgi:hypothetical protein